MKKNFHVKYISIIVTVISLNIFNIAYSQNIDKLYEKIDLLGEVLEKVQDEYVDEIDQAEIIDAAINGALQSLDPYSAYMNSKTFEEMQT